MGMFVDTGQLYTRRVLSLAGPGVKHPRLVSTRLGADLTDLLADQLHSEPACRIVSGSVLDGRIASGPERFLGRYHDQVSVIPQGGRRVAFGWFGLKRGRYSFAGSWRRRDNHQQLHDLSTAQHGPLAAMVPIGAFDRVMPLDILASPLLRSLLVMDTDQAQALGCLELDEEDLALCSFVCPGKIDYGEVLRLNLNQIEREG